MSGEWTKSLKVGDKVIVSTNLRGERVSIVQGITPKGYIRVDGMLFYPNGSQRTSSWYFSRIEEYTEEKAEKIRQKIVIDNALSLMRNYNSNHLDYEKAEKIIAILRTPQNDEVRE